jgi:hypothetical protein
MKELERFSALEEPQPAITKRERIFFFLCGCMIPVLIVVENWLL